jgi:small-conductance mechanosensitive channel
VETFINWVYLEGWRILTIIGACVGSIFIIRRLVPFAIMRTLRVQMRDKRKAEREKRVQTLVRLVTTASAIVLGTVAVLLVLHEVGINIYAGLAAIGIIGVAVGFATQQLIRDYIGGFFIYLENQYNVGDVIRVGTVSGVVDELSLRRTVLRDLDGARHTIANGEIRMVSNLTQEWSRANINISVAYKEDLDRVMGLMRRTWEEMTEDPNWGPFMLSKTPWLLRVDEFGESGITIKMVGETEPVRQWDVMGEFRRRIKRVFDDEGVEIPWPHVKVYHGDSPAPAKELPPSEPDTRRRKPRSA